MERMCTVNHAESVSLFNGDSGSLHTNLGATGDITISLPSSPTVGTNFTFSVQTEVGDFYKLIIALANSSHQIISSVEPSVGQSIWADARSEVITLRFDGDYSWLAISVGFNHLWTVLT